jgi:hypothetical protein
MLLGNVRASLTRDDAQLALRLLAHGEARELDAAEARLREEGFDSILDDTRLLQAIIESRAGMQVSVRLFWYVVVRRAMRRVGEEDRALADYVAAILLHFGSRGRAERISETDDQLFNTLAELMGEVDTPDARRSFLVRQHLGNYALWSSGMFPDRIEHTRWRRGGPDLDYFEEMGRRGFTLAAEHRLAQEHGLDALLRMAASHFAALRCALNEVSDTLMFPHGSSPERLMRQVRAEAAWRWVS